MAKYAVPYQLQVPMGGVRLTGGRFRDVFENNIRFLKGFDMDRMLYWYRVHAGKPAPDIYLRAAQELGVEPSECVVFEDIPAGLLAGIRAGMRTCAVEDTYSEYCMEEKRQLADFVIHDFEDLML